MADQPLRIEFEGRPIEARHGESLAAALTAAGVKGFRSTRLDAERGMFCGMGVCQDCLVEVDGRPNQRACMTKVEGPLVVHREAHGRPLATPGAGHAPRLVDDLQVERPELLVIGAGPGGLSAAIAARRAGVAVTVVDERDKPGGQFFKQLGVEGNGIATADAQHREGADLIETARRLGVTIRTGVTVWGAFAPLEFAATANGTSLRLLPKAAIVATGAYERGWPVPGWTLPSVMTTGAAQTLWRTARRLPGKRVLIAGNGPLNLQLAAELIQGGAQVVAVVEAAPAPGPASLGTLLGMLAASPTLVVDGLRYHARRRSGGTRMIHGAVVSSIEKTADGLSVRLAQTNGNTRDDSFTVDAVCLGYGFEPSNELLRAMGCPHDFDAARRQLVTRRDTECRTGIAAVFALGDCTGLGGARAALAEGTLAGLAAATDLGHQLSTERLSEKRRAQSDLARHRRFQRALWSLYETDVVPGGLATPQTLICRCEEVTFGEVEAALAEGLHMMGAVKRRTRIGMGRCQGRYCAPVLDALLAERFGHQRDEFSGFAPRVPVKPIAIEDLARLEREAT